MTEEQLTALLRLKRYKQPPPKYFDRLLQDIHRRQRADLLQLRLGKIALERMQTFFSEHGMGQISHAGALAIALAALAAALSLTPPGKRIPPKAAVTSPSPALAGGEPRYVIDARPASYEASSSFSF